MVNNLCGVNQCGELRTPSLSQAQVRGDFSTNVCESKSAVPLIFLCIVLVTPRKALQNAFKTINCTSDVVQTQQTHIFQSPIINQAGT